MPDLSFSFGEVKPAAYAAIPTICARLHIANSPMDERIQSIGLNCQVQIQPLGRPYGVLEEAKLFDLFGDRSCWGRTMKPLLWTNVVLKVPPFMHETAIDLCLPCSLDFDVAANKYFYGLGAGSVSVSVLFSGTVFHSGNESAIMVAQIPWDREAAFRLPVDIWQAAIDAHYADIAWLRLSRDTFDRLYRFKVARGIPFFNDLLERLIDDAERHELATANDVVSSGRNTL
jgi:hypothetical protein